MRKQESCGEVSLHPATSSDLKAIFAGRISGTEDRLVSNVPLAPGDMMRGSDLELYLAQLADLEADGLDWIWTIIHDNECVGLCGFIYPHEDEEAAQVYDFVSTEREGRGIATRSLAHLIRKARDHRFRLAKAWTRPGNHASRRVLQKNGFTLQRVSDECGDLLWCRDLSNETASTTTGR